MPITQIDIDDASNLIDELLGNQDEAQAYSQDPEGWLTEHGYDGLNPEAVAQCGASASAGAGAAVASSGAAAAGASGASAVAAVLNPVVYNHYYEVDNSITNNIEANGDVQVVQGDGNVVAGDDLDNTGGQIQTGDGIQVGGDVSDSNLNTGDDVQQAIDQSTNIEGDVDQHTDVNIDDHSVGDGSIGTTTDSSTTVQDQDIDVDAV
ncbi:MAG TPA: hypothetical protein VIH82_11775 [Acidimicrobiia bacterium]|jgi:hypothetical protein